MKQDGFGHVNVESVENCLEDCGVDGKVLIIHIQIHLLVLHLNLDRPSVQQVPRQVESKAIHKLRLQALRPIEGDTLANKERHIVFDFDDFTLAQKVCDSEVPADMVLVEVPFID